MKRFLLIISIAVGMCSVAQAATRGDVKVLEASDAIKYHASRWAKTYLLYAHFPKKKSLYFVLKDDLVILSKSFQNIATTTNDKKTKGLLSYFAYQKAHAEEILDNSQSTQDILQSVLEMSESYTEGAKVISKHHSIPFSPEEKMFATTRSMIEDLGNIAKYYTAIHLIENNPELKKGLDRAINAFEKSFDVVDSYKYQDKVILQKKEQLIEAWHSFRVFALSPKVKSSLPMLVSISTGHMEELLRDIGVYHSQNQ